MGPRKSLDDGRLCRPRYDLGGKEEGTWISTTLQEREGKDFGQGCKVTLYESLLKVNTKHNLTQGSFL